MTASACIAKLKERAETAGYTTFVLRNVEPEEIRDVMPAVAIFFDQEGERRDIQPVRLVRKTLRLLVVLVDLPDEDSEDDLEVQAIKSAEALADALISHAPDRVDTLDGIVEEARIQELNIQARMDTTDAFVSQLKLSIRY